MPPNKLDAQQYTSLLRDLARKHGWQFRKYGIAELQKLGAGAFLAVARGNPTRDAGILKVQYRPQRGSQTSLALVGKGVVFDTA
jgi:leucyl aminopeptidase